jgi:hypothetical protein
VAALLVDGRDPAFVAGVLGLLELVGRDDPNQERSALGFTVVLLGADGRMSTSKTAVAAWTMVFASALVLLSCMVWFHTLTARAAFGGNWDSYLLLLGGPFAAAVVAKGITSGRAKGSDSSKTSTRAAASEAQTVVPSADRPKASDLVAGDAGETSLTDTQYVVFTFVAIAYFVGAFVARIVNFAKHPCTDTVTQHCAHGIALPIIPSALLGLTGLTALTYVGSKAVEKQGVRIVSITPDPLKAGEPMVISLVNVSAAATMATTSVVFTSKAKAPDQSLDPRAPVSGPARTGDVTTVTVLAPPAGHYAMVVITPDGSTVSTGIKID